MASEKSKQLAAIKPAAPKLKCICGAQYDSHMRKDGRGLLARFNNDKHRPSGQPTQYNRELRRALRRQR